jgi:hypothetical protein
MTHWYYEQILYQRTLFGRINLETLRIILEFPFLTVVAL